MAHVVAVTGAGGFIGSHLVEELLASGRTVRALVHYNALGSPGHLDDVARFLPAEVRARLSIVRGDVTDARCMRELVAGCAEVYHLAALIGIPYSYSAPGSYVATNIVGTMNVLEACRDGGVGRLLHTSTSEAYGTALRTPMDESHPLQAQSPYSASKIAADKLAESYHLSFGLPVTTVRPFNTYGPRQSLRAVIPAIASQLLFSKAPTLHLGALDPVRDFTFVTDTAAAFLRIAETPAAVAVGRTYNLGVGAGVTIGETARLLMKIVGVEKELTTDAERLRPAASEVRVLLSDNSRVRAETGWAPRVGFEEGLRRTVEYLRACGPQAASGEYVR